MILTAATRGIALAGGLLLGACQTAAGDPEDAISLYQGARQVAITYLIAHGMAESYVMSGRATATSLFDLVRYDHAALTAISTNAKAPTWDGVRQATGAVRALLDYTTTMEGAEPPAPVSRAAAR